MRVDVLGKGLTEALGEVAGKSGAAELRKKAGQRVADHEVDPRGRGAGGAGGLGEAVLHAARHARAARAVGAAAFDELAVLGRKGRDGALAGEARGHRPQPYLDAALDPAVP